jgi:hypothetical protein
MEAFMNSPYLTPAVLAIIGAVFAWIKRRELVRKHDLEVAVAALESGVTETYQCYVKGLKAENGKLTEAQKDEAREMAYRLAKSIALEQGVSLWKYYSPRLAKALIEKFVHRAKATGEASKQNWSSVTTLP